ncbi:MAG: peptidase MA family metallohydrolase [Candidatus Sumerlaeaceae bacterium]
MNRWFLIGLNIVILGVVLATIPMVLRARKPYLENNRGVEALNAQRYDEAITLLKGAISENPDNPQFKENLLAAYNSKAVALANKGQVIDALAFYEKALEMQPQDERLKQTLLRNYISSLNNLAVERSNAHQFPQAQQFFERASVSLGKLNDQKVREEIRHNYSALLTLWGAELMKRNQVQEARVSFKQSLDLDTSNSMAHLYMGDLGYEENDYVLAKTHYAAALPLDTENRAYLANRLQMIEDESRVESNFKRAVDPKGHFIIHHVEYSNGVSVPELLGILSSAYETIGKDLGIYPARAVNVKLYTAKDFANIAKLPEWAIGIFDGKMRLKVDEVQSAPSQVKDLLFHEYTHAVLAMNVKQKVPAWFHEGLAQLMEPQFRENPREQAQMRDALARNQLDFASLQNSFKDIESKGDAENAYLLSKYFLAFLNRKYGHEKLTNWIKNIAAEEKFEEAFKSVYGLALKDAQEAWIKAQSRE